MKKTELKKKNSENDIKNENSSKNKQRKINGRFILLLVLFIISFTICIIFATKILDVKKTISINYSQIGNIDYKVYLNKNDFYTEKYLDMNKSYVASLIDYIDINFNYLFKIDEKMNMDFDYKIIGELVIENSKGTGRYLEKEYTLLDTKVRKMVQDKKIDIKENIKINYGYYNQLANSFKSTYGVDVNSYLNVYLEVNPKTDDNSTYNINEKNRVSLSIPLSEKAIEIKLNATNQNIIKRITPNTEVVFDKQYLVLEIVVLIPACVILILIIKRLIAIFDIYTPYDRYVNKTLKEYDRLIVETNSKLKTSGYNTIEVKNFTELLDARDNLNLPIIYLNIKPHHDGVFYILSNNDIYLLKVDDEYLNIK